MKSDQSITDPDSGDLRSVFQMHELSRRFDELTRDPRILGMVRQLLGSDVYIHQSRINDKFGFQGSGFNWHSDFETWHSEDGMPRMRAVSASIMLTDNNEFNGPLMLIPGSHHYFVPCQGVTPKDNWKDSLKSQRLGVPSQENLAELVEQGGIQAPRGRRVHRCCCSSATPCTRPTRTCRPGRAPTCSSCTTAWTTPWKTRSAAISRARTSSPTATIPKPWRCTTIWSFL